MSTLFSKALDKLERMKTSKLKRSESKEGRATSTDSLITSTTADASNTQTCSSSSTPPTSPRYEASTSATSLKVDYSSLTTIDDLSGRSREACQTADANKSRALSNPIGALPKGYSKVVTDEDSSTRQRAISGKTLVGALASGTLPTEAVKDEAQKMQRTALSLIDCAILDLQWSAKKVPKSKSMIGLPESPKDNGRQVEWGTKISTRSVGRKVENFTKGISILGKRSRRNLEESFTKVPRELKNLADTHEYAKIETKPVVYEVWSKGKRSQNHQEERSSKAPRELDNLADTDEYAGIEKNSVVREVWSKGKRNRKNVEEGSIRVTRELKNLADTKEYAKIDTKPVVFEVWSKGKLVTGGEPPKKKIKIENPVGASEEPTKAERQKPATGGKRKVWLTKGLYAGQDLREQSRDLFNYNAHIKGKEQNIPPFQPNAFMPLPMWHGQRLLQTDRDFKLPFDVCSPLPPGQPKPDEWRKTSGNRFVGDAAAAWKKTKLFESFSSKCVCSPQGACAENCQNRIMFYECDDMNCGAGRENCTNRAFADLQERRKLGNVYRIGVEVTKTEDRGYGIRSNRSFEPHQIIVEYTGEIITEKECDRRMNEDYKGNECYYLMSFDQNMIIDATKGSIARFVNHSCKPNCRMDKWIVGGKPRMALFAGDAPIATGDELTYDYNFDPFSAKSVEECRCGSDNCRGVLGPRGKDSKPVKTSIKDTFKAGFQAGKRKLKGFLGGEEEEDDNERSPKRRKLHEASSEQHSAPSTSNTMARGAVQAVKTSVTRKMWNARKAVSKSRTSILAKTERASSNTRGQTRLSSRNSSLTLVGPETGSLSKTCKSSLGNLIEEGPGSQQSIESRSKTKKRQSILGVSMKRASRVTSPKASVRKSTEPLGRSSFRKGLAARASSGSPFKNRGRSTKFFEDLLTDELDSARRSLSTDATLSDGIHSEESRRKGIELSAVGRPSNKPPFDRGNKGALGTSAEGRTIRLVSGDDE